MSTRRAAKLVRRARRKAKKMTYRRVRAAGRALAESIIAKRIAEVRKEETPA